MNPFKKTKYTLQLKEIAVATQNTALKILETEAVNKC